MTKRAKRSSSALSQAANQDVVGLLTTLVGKLTSFESKLDTVLDHIISAPRHQPAPAPSPQQRKEHRPMHKVICADCKKECEVPFKPSVGRPVYCKECFSKRKAGRSFKTNIDNKPTDAVPAQIIHDDKLRDGEKRKFLIFKKARLFPGQDWMNLWGLTRLKW